MPESNVLNCGVNVNCLNKTEVIEKMKSAWLKQRNAGVSTAAFSDRCYDAFKIVEKWSPATLEPGLVQPQLNICNVGLSQIR